MAIAKKAFVWGLFAAGGTVSAFLFPALITLFLLIAMGRVPDGLQFENIHAFAASWIGKAGLFIVISLSLWHAAHRLRVVFHDFGVRLDKGSCQCRLPGGFYRHRDDGFLFIQDLMNNAQ